MPQRALAAFAAIAERFFGPRAAARAAPPFNPPNRPRATAAGFFSGPLGASALGTCPVDSSMIWKASSFGSRGRFGFVERSGMMLSVDNDTAVAVNLRNLKLTHYPNLRNCAKICAMRLLKRFLVPLALILILAACNVASIVQLIGQAVAIAEQAAAVTGIIPAEYIAYVTAASDCIAFASTEEASSDSAALKADKITAQCSKFATVALPPGTAANLVALVSKLAVSIQGILNALPATSTAPRVAAPVPEKQLSSNDIAALNMLAGRARAVSATMKRRSKP